MDLVGGSDGRRSRQGLKVAETMALLLQLWLINVVGPSMGSLNPLDEDDVNAGWIEEEFDGFVIDRRLLMWLMLDLQLLPMMLFGVEDAQCR